MPRQATQQVQFKNTEQKKCLNTRKSTLAAAAAAAAGADNSVV
jgi:hypothetical protein